MPLTERIFEEHVVRMSAEIHDLLKAAYAQGEADGYERGHTDGRTGRGWWPDDMPRTSRAIRELVSKGFRRKL